MSGLQLCKGCPDRMLCAQEHYRDGRIDCAHIKALHKAMLPTDESAVPREPHPMPLLEASEVVLRHWDTFGSRGFEAAIQLLRRAVAREKA